VRNFHELGALSVICDSRESVETENKAQYSNVRFVREYKQVLSDPAIHAVALSTPAVTHYEMAKAALEAGKDVYVEKPLAIEVKQGRELVELAEARGRVLMVGHILRYHPAVVKLQELIRNGSLGKLQNLYSNRLNIGKIRTEENILWSFAPHDISVICSLVGSEPVEVSASAGSYLQTGIADVTVTNFTFETDVRAHIFVSWLHPFKEQKLVVVGDRKMAVFDDTAREGKLKIYDKGIEWRAGMPVPRQTAETTLFFDELEPLKLECSHFVACIRDRQQPLTDGPSALRVLKVLEGCQLSLERNGAGVRLDELTAE